MGEPTPGQRVASLLLLRQTRSLLRSTAGRLLFASVLVGYLYLSLTVGQMLVFGPTHQSATTVAIVPNGYPSWNFPELIVIAPNAVLVLPYLSALVMVLVSLGVGLGMSASVVISLRIARRPRSGARAAGALGAVEGLSPALIAALTLGACCSTTAASTAGIGLAAQASGTSVANLLANTWFLNLLQLLVLGVALLAQEQLIEVYGRILGLTPAVAADAETATSVGPRSIAAGLARFYLVVAGLLAVLAMFLAWTVVPIATASPGTWFQWIVVVEGVGVSALLVGLFPSLLRGPARLGASRFAAWAVRGFVGLGAGILLVGVPFPLTAWGVHGFVNELLGAAGAPSVWGGVSPGMGLGAALYVHWGLEYVGLGTFGLLVAIRPANTWRWLGPRRAASADGFPPSRSPAAGRTVIAVPVPSDNAAPAG
ncbi:MAG TPA: hypothetical protein VGU43_00145, partial [Thermoplasmata archaeon]|nr:hypothetical protein [Thermoplasmata archaeon]